VVFLKTDIGYFLSGGTSNTNVALSIGNGISNTSITSGLSNNLFADITPTQALSGIIKFKCFYVKNLNGTQMLQSPKIWIAANTLSAYDEIDLGTANDTTAPTGVVFTHPTSEVIGLELPSLNPNDYKSVWARITVQANSDPIDQNASIIRVRGTPI
jgi:hypothetical protein